MKNQKGISLVELIVVIAILAVVTAVVTISIGTLSSWNVTSCMERLETTLSRTKVDAMSKENIIVTLKQNAKGEYVIKETGRQEEIIGKSSLTVSYIDSLSVEHPIDTTGFMLTYDRASGALKPIIQEVKNTGEIIYQWDGSNYLYCSKIKITNGHSTQILVLVKETGKTYVQ
ncbi:MAG: prepilin-type N-terminal cleavage/methylation domain-containing protein [Lachnospiraceae bacterium]